MSITRRLATCLVCLFLLFASIDRVPDPPGVGPHNNAAASFAKSAAKFLPANQPYLALRTVVALSCHTTDVNAGFRARRPLLPLAFHVDQFADSSPPVRHSIAILL